MKMEKFLTRMQIGLVFVAIAALAQFCIALIPRYPVGQPVSSSVYTDPFDPCDPAYKFLQPAPKDWADQFGNNERTCLIHAVSELRVVVAAQGKRILELEAWRQMHDPKPADPNEGKK